MYRHGTIHKDGIVTTLSLLSCSLFIYSLLMIDNDKYVVSKIFILILNLVISKLSNKEGK